MAFSEGDKHHGAPAPIQTVHLETPGLPKLDIAIHPSTNGRIIVNYPGALGDIDGYNNKYVTLGNHMQQRGLGAVVRCGNPYLERFSWETNLRQMIEYTLEHAVDISGSDKPELLLMGASAGASAIAAVAYQYPEVSRILLLAPSTDAGRTSITDGLSQFAGEVYVVVGLNDEIVGSQTAEIFHTIATNAFHRHLTVITDCDHQFRGETNGRIMSQAPFWAFTKGKKPPFPDPDGGIKLYE